MIKFSKQKKLLENINTEVQIIDSYLSMQTALTEQLSVFINARTDKLSLDNAIVNLNRLKQNIALLNNLLSILENLKSTMEFLTGDGLKTYIDDYNALYSANITTIFAYTSKIEEFIHNVSLGIENVNTNEENSEEVISTSNQITTEVKTEYNSLVDNTLVISEIRKEVILPYNLDNVKLFFNNNLNKYTNIEQVIKENYTFPISHFKPFAISRFREAYRLIRKREHGSKINALSLAFEMFTNYNVHPAIIASCKSIDELDVYLSCLEDNELDDFDKFNIRYEIPPAKVKNDKKVCNDSI